MNCTTIFSEDSDESADPSIVYRSRKKGREWLHSRIDQLSDGQVSEAGHDINIVGVTFLELFAASVDRRDKVLDPTSIMIVNTSGVPVRIVPPNRGLI